MDGMAVAQGRDVEVLEAEQAAPQQPVAKGISPYAAGTATAMAAALSACGGGGSSGTAAAPIVSGGGAPAPAPAPAPTPAPAPAPTPTPAPTTAAATPESDAQAARFLLQAGLSASVAGIAALREEGYEPWLNARMNSPVAKTALQWIEEKGYAENDENRWYAWSYTGDYMIWGMLMEAGNNVRSRMALALSEFFVVSGHGVKFEWRGHGMAYYWDILNKHAFGNFRDLLGDVTLSPAMGVWLNMRGNRKPDARGRQPDENFAREVMQLFSIGLHELNIDGTEKLGADGKPIETYGNDDVTNLAHVFTGFDFDYSLNKPERSVRYPDRMLDSPEHTYMPMTADPSKWQYPRAEGFHSTRQKTFLGTTIPAGTGPDESVRIALDTLFAHPNVGPFFGRQMIQRLVTSNPTPAYVARVAAAFNDDGKGNRGNLRAVFKAILLDPEALAVRPANDQTFGKLREPMLRVIQWARTFGATSRSGKWNVRDASDESALGQSPLRAPSVFNFFRPGYVPSNTQAAANNMVVPEFQLVDEISTAVWVNSIEKIINKTFGTTNDVQASYENELKIAHNVDALLDRISLLMTADQLDEEVRNTIRGALQSIDVSETSSEAVKLRRVHLAVFLTMVSPNYLVQK